jgi:hypothetical protein
MGDCQQTVWARVAPSAQLATSGYLRAMRPAVLVHEKVGVNGTSRAFRELESAAALLMRRHRRRAVAPAAAAAALGQDLGQGLTLDKPSGSGGSSGGGGGGGSGSNVTASSSSSDEGGDEYGEDGGVNDGNSTSTGGTTLTKN